MRKRAVRRIDGLPLALGTDTGVARKENQDRVGVLKVQISRERSYLAVALCDGMGGMVDGAGCAALAIAVFFSTCIRERQIPLQQRLYIAAKKANDAVFAEYEGRGGATLSAVIVESNASAAGINIGDSRIYNFQSSLEQLSRDDTLAGQFSGDRNFVERRNELLQYVGIGDAIEPHIVAIPRNATTLLLTSDGIHFLDQRTIERVIELAGDPLAIAQRLLDIANWTDGRDNGSIAVVNPRQLGGITHDDAGTIGLWDAFGEVQIIGTDRLDALQPTPVSPHGAENGNEWVDTKAEQRSRLRGSKQTKKVSKKPKNELKQKKDAPPRPQLKIKFDRGEDNG
ncbi:PP2C family protein-serine/threonine phosphatase [Reyranella soli]|uniref:PP2C family protein-serine/threonine phosphatase n=1 Tax=Reyranella soli TaxID=1230389 RepID=UPI001478AD7D|nr:serine/threonine protein phosphatase [Reyranella soli]